MQNKKEIGRRIWELFSKNYSYSEIAKELKVSKSVVSNVINYCMPSKDIYDKSIKEIMQNCEKEKEKLQDELYEYYKSIVKRVILQSSIFASLIIAVILFITHTNLYTYFLQKFHLKDTFLINLAFVAILTIPVFIVSYIILRWMNKDEI